jgi:hypothetical protein
MLKVYKVTSYVSVDDAKWRVVGRIGYCCTDEDRDVKFILDKSSFDEAREYLSNNFLDGVYNGETFWRSNLLLPFITMMLGTELRIRTLTQYLTKTFIRKIKMLRLVG